MNDLKNAIGTARFLEQFGEAHGNGGVTLGRLQDEGVADCNGDAEHPHRNHRREVERGDARADSNRLTHGIHVDAGARALRIFALQRMRDAAGEFNDVEAALNVAAGVSNHLAMFRSEEHTSELQSLMRISYAVFCLKKTNNSIKQSTQNAR